MPIFTVTAPNGKTYDVTAPEGATGEQAIAYIQRMLASRESGVSGEFKRGIESIKSSGRTALGALIGSPEEAAARGLERQAEMEQRYAEGPSLERVKRAYEQEGLLAAGKEALGQIPEAIAGQLPNIGATIAGARLGAMAGSLAGPVGTAVGSVAGALAPSLVQQFGSNIERQAAEQQARGETLDISRGRAAAAAAPQAALDVAGQLIPLGRTIAGKVLGKEIDALLNRGSKEAAERLAEKSLARTVAEGTAIGAVAEVPTEITQQMLERWQAGLPLTSDDALAEYGETAYQVGLLAPIGGLGRVAERSAARSQIAEETAQQEVTPEETAGPTEPAPLALPAPEKTNYDKAFDAILGGATPTVSSVRKATNLGPKEAREILLQLEQTGVVTAADPTTGKRSVSQRFTTKDETAPEKSKLQLQREAAEKREIDRLANEEARARKAAETARNKQEREAAKQRAAELRAERQRLSKQIKEQPELPFGAPAPRPSDVAPAGEGETLDLFAARPTPAAPTEAVAEPTIRKAAEPATPETVATKIPTDKKGLQAFGKAFNIGFTAKILREDGPLAGKDISDPAQAAEVRQILEGYASGKPAEGAAEKITTYLKRPEFGSVPVGPVAGTVEPSVPTAGVETGVRGDTGGARGRKRRAVDTTQAGAGPAVGGTEPVSSALDKFKGQAITDAKNKSESTKSRSKLIEINIDDFLRLAKGVGEGEYTAGKLQGVRDLLKSGTKLSSIPELSVDAKGKVTGHEGRHRALALKEAGHTTMPVVFTSNIRWDQQYDPDSVDYIKDTKWPEKLTAEKGARDETFSIPYPIKRDSAWEGTWMSERPAAKAAPAPKVVKPKTPEAAKPATPKTPEAAKPVVQAAPVALTREEETRQKIQKEKNSLNSSAITALEFGQINDKTYQAISNELKQAGPNFEYVRKLLSGQAAPKRAERDIGLKFGPKYKGEAFDADTRRMVEQGDVSGAINRIAQRSSPAVRTVLRKIQALNLGVKIRIGNPTGRFKYAPKGALVDENGNPVIVYRGVRFIKEPSEGMLRGAPRPGYATFASTSPYVAASYGTPDLEFGERGAITPMVIIADRVIEFPVSIRNGFRTFDKFAFDEQARRLRPGQVLVARQVVDIGPASGVTYKVDPKKLYSYPSDVYAFGPGTETKTAIGGGFYSEGASGSYDPTTNTITLDPATGLNDHILIHELVHAALVKVLSRPDLKITKDFTKFFTQIKTQLGDAYGGQDLQEFAAELVGNPEFQALLKTIKAPRSESMFKRIMQAIADFFGFAPNAYESGLKFVSDALDVSEGVEALPWDKMFYGPGNFAAVGEIGTGMTRLAGDTIEQTKNTFSDLKEGGFAKMAFGLLRLDNINTLYGKTLTSIKPLLDAIEKRAGMQEQRIKAANDKYARFVRVERKHAAAVSRMSEMAINARLAEVDILDPNFKVTPENRAEYDKIKGIFNGLPPEVQDIYRTIRKDYDSAFAEYKRMILNSVSPSLAKQLETQFTAQTKVVAYVPFLRRGDYWVEYNDPETNERAAAAFESVRERQRFIDTQLRPKGIASRTYKNLESIRFDPSKLPPTPFVAKIMKDLQEQGAAKQLSPDAIRAQMDAVYQAYLTLLPGQSIAKQFMKSKNVRGMEKDLIRGYGDIMVRWARKMANSEYGPQIDKALEEINAQAAESGNPTIQAAAENIIAQRDFLHSPTYGNLVQTATTLSYFEYIAGNISSALINLTSLPLLVWPMLSRFGFDKATSAMMSAGRTAMNDWSKGKYAKLHQALDDHGQLQHTMAREILEGRRQTTAEFTGLKAKILDGLSIPFTKTEQYNRAVTAIAAYDLAIGNGKPESEAIQYALTTTKDVHTSGMAATGPRWVQHGIGRVFFTFKSFVWNSAFVTARAFHQAFKGESPEVRSAARRQLLGMYGMAYAFAGIKGMPFYGMATTLGTMLQAVAGDDDEPFDVHEELRQFFGELQYKGFANYALNLEIANRAGIATDLVFRDDPRGVQESGYVISAMKQAFGPMVSYLINAERGFQQMQEGHATRGIEAIMPSWVRNGMKGARYMREGALTLKGDPVDTDISAWNTLMQGIGFAPADLSTTYETTSAAKGREREILNRKTKILQAFDIAMSTGDQEFMQEVRERILNFNQAFPMIAITPETLRKSVVGRKVAEREMINGVRFNKKLRPYIEEEFFDDEEE